VDVAWEERKDCNTQKAIISIRIVRATAHKTKKKPESKIFIPKKRYLPGGCCLSHSSSLARIQVP
jgi:hypothetical protein